LPPEKLTTLGDLAVFCGGSHDSFTGQLLALMRNADPGNRVRLAWAFPLEDALLRGWEEMEDPTPEKMTAWLRGGPLSSLLKQHA
jgi:hypothetical protein